MVPGYGLWEGRERRWLVCPRSDEVPSSKMKKKRLLRSSPWRSCVQMVGTALSSSKATRTDTTCPGLVPHSWGETCSWMPLSPSELSSRLWKGHCGETRRGGVLMPAGPQRGQRALAMTELLTITCRLSEAQRSGCVVAQARCQPEWSLWRPGCCPSRICATHTLFVFSAPAPPSRELNLSVTLCPNTPCAYFMAAPLVHAHSASFTLVSSESFLECCFFFFFMSNLQMRCKWLPFVKQVPSFRSSGTCDCVKARGSCPEANGSKQGQPCCLPDMDSRRGHCYPPLRLCHQGCHHQALVGNWRCVSLMPAQSACCVDCICLPGETSHSIARHHRSQWPRPFAQSLSVAEPSMGWHSAHSLTLVCVGPSASKKRSFSLPL